MCNQYFGQWMLQNRKCLRHTNRGLPETSRTTQINSKQMQALQHKIAGMSVVISYIFVNTATFY
ncbi:hypothetical protein LDENG_00047680 [Lucifuga dentata]|nr:hypothetical protein LDENG_00047680 [Lucifuga dentata]